MCFVGWGRLRPPGSCYSAQVWLGGCAVNRDDLKQYLVLIEREIENGKRAIEEQRLLIKNQVASGLDHQYETVAILTRLLQAQRVLEDNRDQLAKSINS
jgi:hypothetical protein